MRKTDWTLVRLGVSALWRRQRLSSLHFKNALISQRTRRTTTRKTIAHLCSLAPPEVTQSVCREAPVPRIDSWDHVDDVRKYAFSIRDRPPPPPPPTSCLHFLREITTFWKKKSWEKGDDGGLHSFFSFFPARHFHLWGNVK